MEKVIVTGRGPERQGSRFRPYICKMAGGRAPILASQGGGEGFNEQPVVQQQLPFLETSDVPGPAEGPTSISELGTAVPGCGETDLPKGLPRHEIWTQNL